MPPVPRLPRRAALTLGAAGLVAVAACDDGSEPPPPPPSPSPDADADLVDRIVAEITAVWRLTADRAELAAVHAAHVAALDGGITERPVRRRVDPARLREREEALRVELVAASMAADSGRLARLLASMSAAVAQQVVVL